MNSARIVTVVTFVGASTGIALLVLSDSPWVVAGAAMLITGSALALVRHLWRAGDRRAKQVSATSTRALSTEITRISGELQAATSSLREETKDVSSRVTAFSHGVLEYVSQLELDVDELTNDLEGLTNDLQGLTKAVNRAPDRKQLLDRVIRSLERNDRRSQRYRDEILAELSGVVGLYQILQPPVPYPRFGGWAIDGDCARFLVSLILTRHPKFIVELGSGLSTILAGQAMNLAGVDGQVISLEHDEGWLGQTQTMLADHGVTNRCRVFHAPLVDTVIDGETFRWYDLTEVELPDQVDLIFVDGPPKATGPLARYPAVPLLYDRLSVGGTIVMDDAGRPDEREAVERWGEAYPDLVVRYMSGPKGTAEITKLPE